MVVKRNISRLALQSFEEYPILTITGPRQSGKTTLARTLFPKKAYANLEHPTTREFAQNDPIDFLQQYPDGAIIDEIQRVPELTSHLQVIVDREERNGMFVLTGSHQFSLRETVNQSLAGRTAMLKLFPFSLQETLPYGKFKTDELLWRGFYPRIYDKHMSPEQAHSNYFETYIERDLRQLIHLKNLSLFQRFVRLCAGQVGRLLNLNSLASDTGISQPTARDWLSILESSFIIYRLPPYFANIRKRLIKTPKLYFYDTGLAVWLSGIEDPAPLHNHPLRGAFYENMVVSEILKYRINHGHTAPMMFYRDQSGNEIDLLYPFGGKFFPIEIKSGLTFSPSWLDRLNWFHRTFPDIAQEPSILAYPGEKQKRKKVSLTDHYNLGKELDRLTK